MENSQKPDAILGLIRSAESTSYDDFYRGSKLAPPKPLSQMTVKEVRAWQRQSVRSGSASTAAGGYQIIGGTLDSLVKSMRLSGNELFDADLQDRMGMQLMVEKGYNSWTSGKITDAQFANNLAKTWAGLPIVNGPKKGRSYYAGDGLNKSNVDPTNVFKALNAARTGGTYDVAWGNGGVPSISGQPSEYEAKVTDFTAGQSLSGPANDALAQSPAPSYRPMTADVPAPDAEENQFTAWDGFKLAVQEEWIGMNVARQMGREEFTPDASYEMTDDEFAELTDGLDEAYWSGLFAATSGAHARALRERMMKDQEADQKLASLGWGGLGLRIGAAILDPVAIALSAATEGAAAPLVYGAKVGRIGRALRAGTAAGAVNAGIDGYLATQDETMGWADVATSAAAGFVLGGALGARAGRIPEDKALEKALQKAEGDNIMRTFVGGVADGSIGAKRVEQDPDFSVAEIVGMESEGAPKTAMAGARFDRSAVLKSSESDVMRRVGGGLLDDPIGNADGSAMKASVEQKVARDERVRLGRFYRTYNQSYNAWLKEQGKRLFWQHGAGERAEFNRQVSMAVRRDLNSVTNQHVNAVAGQMKKEFADLLEFGKQSGVRGFDQVKANHNYMVRRHRIERLDDLVNEFGEGNINRLVAESIRSANRKYRAKAGGTRDVDEIDYEDALTMAAAYVKSIRSRRYGEFNLNRALSGQDVDTLKMMLDDAGMSPEEITRITDKVRLDMDNGEQGRISSAKWRLDLDEQFSLDLVSAKGAKRTVKIEDFLENDAEVLFGQYVRSVSAAGHLEGFLKEFRVRDAEGFLPAHAPSFETVKAYIAKDAGAKGMSSKQFQKEMEVLENSYKMMMGIAIERPSSARTAQRFIRDFNFSRIGGQLGVAQLAEVGNIIGNGGMRVLMQNIPALKGIYANAKTGKFSDAQLNEIEAIWGFGTDLERMNMSPIFDEAGGVEQATRFQKTDHFLQRAKKVTVVGSGMGHVNMALQRLNARVLVQRFMDDANGTRDINTKRLRVMGIDDDLHERIQQQMRKHVSQTDGMLGRKVSTINIEKWDDISAKNAFINGVDRWARKSIQENDIGSMPDFMSKDLAKTIFQFRSFMLGAWSKQTLSGLHHRDWEAASAFLTTMFFGGLFYAGQTYVNSIGRDDRQDYLNDRLSPDKLGLAAFQRSGFSSILPVGLDMGTTAVGLDPIFDFRTSGLKSGGVKASELILSNPTGDLIDGAARATSGIVQGLFNEDYTFSEQDAKAVTKLFLLQNAFAIRNVLAAVNGSLPQYSQ